jgi:rhodanese-related sulfurtransferase
VNVIDRGWAIHAPCDDGCVSSGVQSSHVPEISREELIAALRGGSVTLVDVLSPESFAANHIPQAINLPVADIPSRAAEVVGNRDAPIVVYCGGPT